VTLAALERRHAIVVHLMAVLTGDIGVGHDRGRVAARALVTR
jgi:hypothetical protein